MAWIWILVLLGLAADLYIRLAPSDAGRWHVMRDIVGDRDLEGGVLRRVTAGPDGLKRLDAIIRAEPRTTVLAGSVAEGMVTYVTRSRVIGFPDYTTVRQSGDVLEIFARLRFGRGDMGVNRARVSRWLAALAQT